MEYRILGGTGIRVSTHCLGTMAFGAWGNQDHDECIRTIHQALDAGINFVDTADMYSDGESEEIVGKAIVGRRDEVVLASKFHNPMGSGPNDRGNSRVWIMRAVEASLRRLGTDHLDLYQVHRPEEETDIEETLAALTDLQRAGTIRAFGTSTYAGWQLVQRPIGVRATRSRALPDRAAPVLDLRAPRRTRRVSRCPGVRARGAGVGAPRSWVADGPIPPRRLRSLARSSCHAQSRTGWADRRPVR